MSYIEYKGEKYLVITDIGGDYRCYFFEDLDKIQSLLDDGSFEEGALLIEVSDVKRLEYERIVSRAFKSIS